MDIAALHRDEALRRREFPVAERQAYLANAAVCPLPRRCAEAISAYAAASTGGDQELTTPPRLYRETRGHLAALLGCAAADVALVGPTSIGLSLIANGIRFEPGDNVLYSPDDYPSNTVVWMNLERRGVEVRPLLCDEPGRVTLAEVEAAADGRTRLVALASAHFVTGYRLDLNRIGAWLRSRGILFSVDAIQTLGAFPTPVEHVDFLAADAHKWLLGPCSAGVLYVAPSAREVLEPTLLGWNNVLCPHFVTPDEIVFKRDARRYEAGSHNIVGLVGLHASLNLLADAGAGKIEETVLAHTRRIRAAARAKGYTLAGGDENRLSGITSFRRDGVDPEQLHQELAAAGVAASLRQTRDGRGWVRFSPHAYNTSEEVGRALELI